MSEIRISTTELKDKANTLHAGDRVLLSGTVYTARDAAHKRFFELLDRSEKLPFDIEGACIYYCGPTPTPEGLAIGSAGPTTSSRMDPYAPRLLDLGLKAMIGKGARNDAVNEALKRNGAVYFAAIGGAGALYSKCITRCEVVAFDDLGCESVKCLELKDFPVIVATDSFGKTLY